MTPEQHRVLIFVDGFIRLNDGVAPTIAQVSKALGYRGKSNPHRLLSGLKARGYVDWLPFANRSLRVLKMPDGSCDVETRMEALESRLNALEGQGVFKTVGQAADNVLIDLRGKIR